jgi:hypothetical protein
MAQKESAHREIVDDMTTQLTQLHRQHDELTVLSRDQACYPCTTSVPTADDV